MLQRTHIARWMTGFIVAVVLVGCGYHLQPTRRVQALPLVMDKTFVMANNPYNPLVQRLKRVISYTNATLVKKRDEATAIVHVLSMEKSRRVIAVDNRNRAEAYELRLTVRFSLTADNRTLLAPQTVWQTREYEFDPDFALAAKQQARQLYRSMRDDLVYKIMRQFAALRQTGQQPQRGSGSRPDPAGSDGARAPATTPATKREKQPPAGDDSPRQTPLS